MTRPAFVRHLALVLAALCAVTGLAACSQGRADRPGGVAATEFNQADVDFATAMSPYHMQALIMVELAESRASSAEVRDLATRIKAVRGPEIDQLAEWILDWGARGGSMPPHGDEHHGPGMLADAQMDELRAADGARFDRLFLEGMIAHHEGAITMAREELQAGLNPDAKAMAQSIITSQQAEIDEMRGLLSGG